MSKRILLTGSHGFIGRVLLTYFLKDPDIELIDCVDNLCNSSHDPADPLFQDGRIRVTISNVQDMGPMIAYDEIWHLASPVGPVGVLKYAGKMGPMIIADTAKMANWALATGAKLIDISTSEVYGQDPCGIPQVENIPKIVPSNTTVRLEYGVSKLCCEVFLANMVRTTSLQCNMIRPYNIVSFGQQASAGFVLPRLIEQALAGLPLTVYQPGTQRRTFTDVRDFVEGMIHIMKHGKNGEIYNVGNPANLHSILELAEMVIKKTGTTSKISIVDPKTLHGDLFEGAWEKIPNITKVQTDTGWTPFRTLEDIVDEAVRGYQNV